MAKKHKTKILFPISFFYIAVGVLTAFVGYTNYKISAGVLTNAIPIVFLAAGGLTAIIALLLLSYRNFARSAMVTILPVHLFGWGALGIVTIVDAARGASALTSFWLGLIIASLTISLASIITFIYLIHPYTKRLFK